MKHNTLQALMAKGCVCTGSTNCDMCPYCIYASDTGSRMCEREMYEECCKTENEEA